MTGLAFPKGRPIALEREDRRKARQAADEKENQKVRARSGGLCEAVWLIRRGSEICGEHCHRRASEVHHLVYGIGVRGRGLSALAANKVHLCRTCHRDIHAHVLVPDGDSFRRVT